MYLDAVRKRFPRADAWSEAISAINQYGLDKKRKSKKNPEETSM